MFKSIYIFFSLLLFSSFLISCDNSANGSKQFITTAGKTTACQEQKVENEFIVQWKNGKVSKVTGMTQDKFIKNYLGKHSDKIIIAEPNYKLNFIDSPFKTFATCSRGNWAPKNIKVEKLWDAGFTGKDILIAVSDSGVDVSHPSLKNRIAYNMGESGLDDDGNDKTSNGLDDDNNGYVDDYIGYDFIDNDGSPEDTNGHGTGVAGTIASEHNSFFDENEEEQKILGIAPGAKIIPIKFISEFSADTEAAVNSLQYAVARGANIINASWGGNDCSTILPDYVKTLEKENLLFVAASGNERKDLDNLGPLQPIYPASLNLKNQITVGAIGFFGNRAKFSNFGENSVELFAPGSEIKTLALPFKFITDFIFYPKSLKQFRAVGD